MTLLEFDNVRIDVGGAPLISGLTLQEPGPNAALVGGWGAWFQLLAAGAELRAGSARVGGARAEFAVREGVASVALCDPPLPARSKVLDYLELSAGLRGGSRRQARELALAALEGLELHALGKRRIADLSKVERRALSIAHALLGTPKVVCLETPLSELDAAAKAFIRALIDKALTISAAVVSFVRQDDPAERSLIDRLERVLVLDSGALLAQGPADRVLRPGSRYAVTVSRSAREFSVALREAGANVEPTSPPRLAAAILATSSESIPQRFLVELPDGRSSDLILDTALATKAPVIELLPLDVARRSEPQ